MEATLNVGTVALGALAVVLLINIISCFMRGLRKSLLRLATAVLAAVGAYFFAPLLCDILAESLLPMLESWIASQPELGELMAQNGAASEAIFALLKMLITPILFVVAYAVIKLVMLLPYLLVARLTRGRKKRVGIVSRFAALPVGVLMLALTLAVLLLPIFGYMDLANEAVSMVSDVAGSEAQLRWRENV